MCICKHFYNIGTTDYSFGSSGKVTFTPGGPMEQTVQLSVDKDQLLELNETYLLRLHLTNASITAGARIGTNNQTRVTIINDDSKFILYVHTHTYITLVVFCYVCTYMYTINTLEIQVHFNHQSVSTREFEDVIIPVGFSPQKTTIPFTVRIETFDLSPSDAQGFGKS